MHIEQLLQAQCHYDTTHASPSLETVTTIALRPVKLPPASSSRKWSTFAADTQLNCCMAILAVVASGRGPLQL